jgi:predicted SAM-dependent methyltransferase
MTTRLHIGSGAQRIPGFLNVDLRPFPGVDVVADVTRGLDYRDGAVEAVFAEHFLEHLPLAKALDFLVEIHRVLDPDDGWLRLSTPNLDWVWQTHYRLGEDGDTKRKMAFALNRAFHGWEHKFLWNREMLEEALRVTGYEDLRWPRYGESDLEIFQGVERHETYDDDPGLPHVVIVEARKGARRKKELEAFRGLAREEFLRHVDEGY